MTWKEVFVQLEATAGKRAGLLREMWRMSTPPDDDDAATPEAAREFYGHMLAGALSAFGRGEYDVRMVINEVATFFNNRLSASVAPVALCDPAMASAC